MLDGAGEEMGERQKYSNNIKRLDDLYEFCLVLLGVLSAAEFQYYLAVEQKELYHHALWVFTMPFIFLILYWLIKEVFADVTDRRFRMILTDFCWSFWAVTLLYYLLVLSAGFSVYFLLMMSILLILSITSAYDRVYARAEGLNLLEYWKTHFWLFFVRWLVFFVAYLFLLQIVLPR